MKSSLLSKDKPPVCLHILGQDLVNALHAEGREVREAARALLAHHRIRDIEGISDTLDPRIERLKFACGIPESEVGSCA